jgi:hypothetical protein
MKSRFVRHGERQRFMIRGPFTEDTLDLSQWLISTGYKPVGIVRYFIHVFFWKRWKLK